MAINRLKWKELKFKLKSSQKFFLRKTIIEIFISAHIEALKSWKFRLIIEIKISLKFIV